MHARCARRGCGRRDGSGASPLGRSRLPNISWGAGSPRSLARQIHGSRRVGARPKMPSAPPVLRSRQFRLRRSNGLPRARAWRAVIAPGYIYQGVVRPFYSLRRHAAARCRRCARRRLSPPPPRRRPPPAAPTAPGPPLPPVRERHAPCHQGALHHLQRRARVHVRSPSALHPESTTDGNNSPVYEYPLNGQWIMMDIDDGYILWTGIWKGASLIFFFTFGVPPRLTAVVRSARQLERCVVCCVSGLIAGCSRRPSGHRENDRLAARPRASHPPRTRRIP